MATVRVPSLQASGNTTIDPYLSHFVWTISSLSMSAANAELLASILSEHYKCSHNWDGQWYLGMTIDWDYVG